MSKKKEFQIDQITIETINDRISDSITFMKAFRQDAEIKLNHSREITETGLNKIDGRLDKMDERIGKIEAKNEILSKHQFEIDELKKDMTNIKSKLETDVNRVKDTLDCHLEDHKKKLPEEIKNNYKVATIFGIIALMSTIFFTMLFTGAFSKIFKIIGEMFI